MNDKSKAPLKVAKGTDDVQGAKTSEATKPQTKPTIEQLLKENEELKKQLSSVPVDLDSKIEYFNHKKELIRKFNLLHEKKDELGKYLDIIAELSTQNDFTNDRFEISITDGDRSYNQKNIFVIKNPEIIGEVITFILGRIEAKETTLKKEIEA